MESATLQTEAPVQTDQLPAIVGKIVAAQPVTDMHTHVFSPAFGASPSPDGRLLWGIDELLTYHYLIAEVFRSVPAGVRPYDHYWRMTKAEQADHIWQELFINRSPVSEACRGVITTLRKLGLDPNDQHLDGYRQWFNEQNPSAFIDKVMQVANVDCMVMTNEVFDEHEHQLWLNEPEKLMDDDRFRSVLRIDLFLSDWPAAVERLQGWGYDLREDFSGDTVIEATRFLNEWIDRMKPVYVAMSLDPSFMYPHEANCSSNRFIRKVLMPVLEENNLAWAMMIGSKRGINPSLREGGDIGGRADVMAVANLCRDFPNNKFLCTMLSRENQHELCVVARKFGNLMPFGCWWFLNNPSLIEEITRMRLELLGTSFVPQHSDARILDQLIYKWDHSRTIIARVLADKYADLAAAGGKVTRGMIERDVRLLLRDNFRVFVGLQ